MAYGRGSPSRVQWISSALNANVGSSNGWGGSSTRAFSLPAGIAVSDKLLLIVALDIPPTGPRGASSPGTLITSATPTGWTLLFNQARLEVTAGDFQNRQLNLYWFHKDVTGADLAAGTVTVSLSADPTVIPWAVDLLAFRGVGAGAGSRLAFDASSLRVSGFVPTTDPNCPTARPAQSNGVLLGSYFDSVGFSGPGVTDNSVLTSGGLIANNGLESSLSDALDISYYDDVSGTLPTFTWSGAGFAQPYSCGLYVSVALAVGARSRSLTMLV